MFRTLKAGFLGVLAVAGISACGEDNDFVIPAGDYTGMVILTEDDPGIAGADRGMVTMSVAPEGTVSGVVTFFNAIPLTLPPTDDWVTYEFSGTIDENGFSATGDADDESFSLDGTIDAEGLVNAEISADGVAGTIIGLANNGENVAVACGGFYSTATDESPFEIEGRSVYLQRANVVHALFLNDDTDNFDGGFTATLSDDTEVSCPGAIDEGCDEVDNLTVEGELTVDGETDSVTFEGGFDYYADQTTDYSYFELEGDASNPDAYIEFGGDTGECWD